MEFILKEINTANMTSAKAETHRAFNEFLEAIITGKFKSFEVRIKRERKNRSLDANAYFHVLVDKIAKKLSKDGGVISPEEIKVKINLEYGTVAKYGNQDAIITLPKTVWVDEFYHYSKWLRDFEGRDGIEYSQYLFYKRTSTLNTEEMSQLISGAIREAQELGIETATPDELAKMIALWGETTKMEV